MPIKTLDEILNDARQIIGENTSDEALSFMDDLSDTISDYVTKTSDNTNWQQKYEENDREWRKRYADRFNRATEVDDEEDDSYELPDPPKKTYLDLFSEVKPNG